MVTLRVEFFCPDYDLWKQSFDADPLERGPSGVVRHSLLRAHDDPNTIVVELEFERAEEAEALRSRGAETWKRAEANGVMKDLRFGLYDELEHVRY